MSCQITSFHVMSRHVSSRHATPRHATPRHATPLRHVVSCHVCHVTFSDILSCHQLSLTPKDPSPNLCPIVNSSYGTSHPAFFSAVVTFALVLLVLAWELLFGLLL